jgi:hypothetical protein
LNFERLTLNPLTSNRVTPVKVQGLRFNDQL